MTALEPLPRANSGAFKALFARVAESLDLVRMAFVLDGALDRDQLEDLLRRGARGRVLAAGDAPRPQVVAALTRAYFSSPRVAWQVMRELDRSCHRERHLVASMESQQVEVPLASLRALEFRRERARVIWALVRDGRGAHVAAGIRLLNDAFETFETAAREQRQLERAEPEVLAERLKFYEDAIREAGELLHQEQRGREGVERERAELLARLGVRERAYQEECARRRAAEDAARRARQELSALQTELEGLREHGPVLDAHAPEFRRDDRLQERHEKLQQRVRVLEERNATLARENEELRRQWERVAEEQGALLRQLVARERAAHARVSTLREALKTARSIAANAPPVDPSMPDGEPLRDRVGVFLDASNLQASARRDHGGKVDFRLLLQELVGERRRAIAIAFVIDNDGDEQAGFP
ncbi:MAG: hypothetical protein ACO3JL_14205, partial [Myxococcota bacterium]